jgi:hypothetical protein
LAALLALFILATQATPDVISAKRQPDAPARVKTAEAAPAVSPKVFLPHIRGGVSQIVKQPMIVGTYPVGQYLGDQSVVNQFLIGLDTWAGLSRAAGKGHSLGGTFMALEDQFAWYNIPHILDTTWNSDYTPFVNIDPDGRSAADIANGCCDAAIQTWADLYLAWANQGNNRRAFIAPMPEMNGNWTTWGMNPTGFKSAYLRIKSIFESRGVTRNKIWWVFVPNGWSYTPYHIADYYPGDPNVDVIGFSSYNQTCQTTWQTPIQVFEPWINEIRDTVSANKPIFVSQTATGSAGGDKNQWLRDAYAYLYQQGVRGVMYFNGNGSPCDYAVYRPDQGATSIGYKDAVSTSNVHYVAPSTLSVTTLPP